MAKTDLSRAINSKPAFSIQAMSCELLSHCSKTLPVLFIEKGKPKLIY